MPVIIALRLPDNDGHMGIFVTDVSVKGARRKNLDISVLAVRRKGQQQIA
jgi:hypothetical protein